MNSKIKKVMFIILILTVIFLIILSIYDNYKKQYEIEEVIDEKYKVNIVDNKMGIVDTNGNVVIDYIYDAIQIPNPSKPIFICFYDFNPEVGSYRTKVINENGTEIFTKYNEVSVIELVDIDTNMPFEKSVLKYREDNKWGLIDLKGNIILQPKYDSIEGLRNKEGELLICEDGKYGVINTKGAELIKAEYDYISGDEYYTEEAKYALSGYILGLRTENGYRYGYMNCKRKVLLETEYNEIQRLGGIGKENTDEDIIIVANKGGQYGLIKNKKVIIDFRYQSIDYSGVENLFLVTRSSKTGVYNSLGEKILAVKYNEVDVHDTYIQTKLNNEAAYYNLLGNRVDKNTIEELKEKK